ncbi:hypothetical protein GCM10007897_15450 [Sphingobium jiangsuense]|uniref:Capsule polysaccharide biosynthesis protein n=1 Tax=Sphingobium jiangsuense TaxID=870476 RepID=A0A7W6BF96_9SPHN|nr:hypothetical protein [Sphingobium jiangsuense]MBB3925009.1 hypothetical protein [Sphingobium jiangsuense]GLT00161.1 hypothetical protein GCM10007897_15450 [Sphingobium jiangsuense]
MKVLFYLPVVTPWWFDNVMEPLIRIMAREAHVSVLAPAPWSFTGVGEREMQRMADLPDVDWYIMNRDDHPSTRTIPDNQRELVDFVHSLAPDYTFCRAADIETPLHFPGVVRYVMEGDASPLRPGAPSYAIKHLPFDHGEMPDLPEEAWRHLETAFAPVWEDRLRRFENFRQDRDFVLDRAGIPADKPFVLLPLEYEHPENFFLMHRLGAFPNDRLVEELVDRLPDTHRLVVTDHPLNKYAVDGYALEEVVDRLGDKAILIDAKIMGNPPTEVLSPHADAMILGDSKCYSIAAFFGTPMLRRSRFATGGWMNAETDLDRFLERLGQGTLSAPDAKATRRWFAFHFANEAFTPDDPALTPSELIDRMVTPINPDRWDRGLARFGYHAAVQGLAA